MSKMPEPTDQPQLKTLLVEILAPNNPSCAIEAYVEEFENLVKTLGLQYAQTWFTKLRSIDKAHFLTKGKLEELKKICDENNIEEIVFSELLTPLQERNLEKLLHCTVWDREKLILEIFKNAAHSAEGKLQVEMAEIEFLKSRLSGRGIELAQQEGMIGSKGPGETSKEELKRHLASKFKKAQARLEALQKSRDIQRKKRLESKIPLICLVGYTNAGKSSLLNILTKSSVEVEDILFKTLDITTREFFIDGKKVALISDTVGFISQLPHHLIEAFKSTLDELKYATLLFHVIDASNATWEEQVKVVDKTLKDIEVSKKTICIFNKIDKLNSEELKILKEKALNYTPNVFIHTKSKEGIKDLVNFLKINKF